MHHFSRRSVARCYIAVVAVSLSALPASKTFAQVQVTAGQGVSFTQEFIDYFDDGSEDVSPTAALNINLSQVNAATGVAGSGYLNVVNADGWAVENLPVFSNTSTYVDLTTGDGVNDLAAGTDQTVYFSAQPLNAQPANAASHFTLAEDDINPGGLPADPGAGAFVEPGAIGPNLNGVTKSKIQAGHSNINAAFNQCAPAAAANGLTYLRSVSNIALPTANSEGRGTPGAGTFPNNGTVYTASFNNGGESPAGDPTDSLVGLMDLAMVRSSVNRKAVANNNPTPYQNQLNGYLRTLGHYNSSTAVSVNYESFNNALFTASTIEGIASNPINGGKLDSTTAAYMYDEMTKGSVVSLDYAVVRRRPTGGYSTLYGHAVDIVGMAYVKDVPYILLSSDLEQTNIDLSDGQLGKDAGLFWASMNTVNFQNKPFIYLTGVPGADNQTTFAYISGIVTVDALPEPATVGLIALGSVLALRRRAAN